MRCGYFPLSGGEWVALLPNTNTRTLSLSLKLTRMPSFALSPQAMDETYSGLAACVEGIARHSFPAVIARKRSPAGSGAAGDSGAAEEGPPSRKRARPAGTLDAFLGLPESGRGGHAAQVAASSGARRAGGWQFKLAEYARNPGSYADQIVHSDDACVVIRDKYPKVRSLPRSFTATHPP